jgi:uncharacterized protein (DUF952 family)
MILHVCLQEEWSRQGNQEFYHPQAYQSDGFIHLCLDRQLSGVLSRYFSGKDKLCILYVDESKLNAPLKYEDGTDGDSFPHLYGLLNKNAVVRVEFIR